MPKPPISVTIISCNEEQRIGRAIESVRWADEVVVVDSGSTDRTVEVAKNLGARVIERPWPGYGQQKNFAQSEAKHDWILSLDADEVVSPELAREIQDEVAWASAANRDVRGFRLPRKTWYLGRWILHGGWYPNYLVRLADRRFAKWTEPHVHEALEVRGQMKDLQNPLLHYTFRNIREQILTNLRYSRFGYEDLRASGRGASLVKLLLKPIGKFIETYLLKRGFLDGMPGFIISVNAAHSIFMKYAYFFERE
jgi:glycosyltransferase involved in cell wall biosynthesis